MVMYQRLDTEFLLLIIMFKRKKTSTVPCVYLACSAGVLSGGVSVTTMRPPLVRWQGMGEGKSEKKPAGKAH